MKDLSLLILLTLKWVSCSQDVFELGGTATTSTHKPEMMQSSTEEIIPPPTFEGECFYADNELCQAEQNSTTCDCHLHPVYKKALYCCNVTDIERAFSCAPNLSDLQFLHIRNATLEELDFSDAKWKFFETIAITDGNIKRIPNDFYKFSATKCLNLSNNNLFEMNTRVVKNLMHIEYIDISHNNLSSIPNSNGNQKNLTMDARENHVLLCKSVLEVLERGGIKFIEPERTFCLTNQTFNWFNSTDVIPLRSLQRIKQLQNECPTFDGNRSCICETERLNYEQDDQLVFTAKVDCSGLGLTHLPDRLPLETVTLNVSNNKIVRLSAFNGKESYAKLVKFYADDNLITEILDLEGSQFIENFDHLFLRRNKLRTIPIYLFSNTLDRNPRTAYVSIEGNPFDCNCAAAKTLKIWLLARQNHIIDYQTLRCQNTHQRILDLQEAKLCQSPHVWTDYIYWIIGTEVFLLLALICKVSYDYFVFKTSGYLPWPASQIPKIPFCDWLCET